MAGVFDVSSRPVSKRTGGGGRWGRRLLLGHGLVSSELEREETRLSNEATKPTELSSCFGSWVLREDWRETEEVWGWGRCLSQKEAVGKPLGQA